MAEFKFKPFNEMTEEDYRTIGFKSGLEVHQQLLTEKKLFCRCPAGKLSHEYDAEILRHMRPTLSEMGEYDGTALMEFKTKKNITYRIHHDTVCTYEMDDTPPFMMNEQALDIALEIGMLQEATLVDEIHIARKQYLDGSIPTGFQRTAIISVGGKLPYKDGFINLIQMSIEEDSCREESDIGHRRVYIADRLGMPLIETVTHPEMKTPQEVAEVCNVIRRLTRSTGKVRTGIGAGRQDVNVSVTGGTRIEIKGVSRIPYIPLLTYNEAMRQWNLLRLMDELHKRGIKEDTFDASYEDVTKSLRKTRYQPINDAIAEGKKVNCVKLTGFRDLLTWKTQTDTYFSKEISDRVRVIACITKLPNIIHSDFPTENLSSSDWQKLKKTMNAGDDDTLVLVWGDDIDAETGAKEVIIRAKEATIGIPSETRQALSDGTNGFERILPGPDRMYPDTDLPPKQITEERLNYIRDNIATPYWELEKWYQELEIPDDTIQPLAISRFSKLFEFLVKEWEINPVLASVALVQFPKRLKKRNKDMDLLSDDLIKGVFDNYRNGRIPKSSILYYMDKALDNGFDSDELFEENCSDLEMDSVIEEESVKLNSRNLYVNENKSRLLMGMVMDRLRGRIDGPLVYERLFGTKKEGK